MNKEPGLILGNYRLVEKLGEGGMGVVWKARDLKLDRDVAIKFLSEDLARSPERRVLFEREAKAVAALSHPNIVTIHAVAETEGTIFFIMELVKGKPLSELIEPKGVPLDRFLKVAVPLSNAVAAAHDRGIIHRDLKPGNVMLDSSGALKVLDFGLARILPPPGPPKPLELATTATIDSDFAGTVVYMSPEQLKGEPVDHRSDIFSLGVLLFEWATGRLPFSGRTRAEIVAAVLKDDPLSAAALNPRLPKRLDRILRHCLEREPRYRMSSTRDLRDELELLSKESGELPADEIPSIAVLPFSDMSREKDQAYFCEGIAEEIINALCRVRGVRVASRSSSFRFGSSADLREISNTLQVETVLEGSVRKSENRLRITVQLNDARHGFNLWSQSFDRELSDVFSIQQEIASNVVRALQVTLTPQEKGALTAIPTQHVQAYDYYLKGRSFYYRYGRHEIEFALQLFTRATELDPGYALAYAGQADCWSYIYLYSERKDSVRLQAENAGRRAAELAPESAQAQASLAMALSLGDDKAEARAAFERAIELDPNLFEAWYFYARYVFAQGELERAVELYKEAMRVRPEDFYSPLLVAPVLDELKRHEEARAWREKGIALVARHIDLHPDDARASYMGANGLVALGEREKGLEWARRARKIDPEDPMLLYNLGCIHSLAGDIEEALDCLEKAAAGGLLQKGWYENDSDLDPLRGHPRFKALLDAMS
ncbi:MAG: protein kinase [Candidatus Aminicenantes bacterium]|nr:protein kinase [Candidatus Aminicenantes bacterium]